MSKLIPNSEKHKFLLHKIMVFPSDSVMPTGEHFIGLFIILIKDLRGRGKNPAGKFQRYSNVKTDACSGA